MGTIHLPHILHPSEQRTIAVWYLVWKMLGVIICVEGFLMGLLVVDKPEEDYFARSTIPLERICLGTSSQDDSRFFIIFLGCTTLIFGQCYLRFNMTLNISCAVLVVGLKKCSYLGGSSAQLLMRINGCSRSRKVDFEEITDELLLSEQLRAGREDIARRGRR